MIPIQSIGMFLTSVVYADHSIADETLANRLGKYIQYTEMLQKHWSTDFLQVQTCLACPSDKDQIQQ